MTSGDSSISSLKGKIKMELKDQVLKALGAGRLLMLYVHVNNPLQQWTAFTSSRQRVKGVTLVLRSPVSPGLRLANNISYNPSVQPTWSGIGLFRTAKTYFSDTQND